MSASPGHTTELTPRVLFACGGTGGHVYPAIAIANELRDLRPEAELAFAGTRDRMEWEAVPRAGYEIREVAVQGFQRGLSRAAIMRNVRFPIKLGKGIRDSLRLVKEFAPHVVVGTGGYVAGPVGLAAALRRVPLVLQEQNAYAGATNKLLARFAQRIFIAFEAARAYFPANKTDLAGNPVRRDLLEASLEEAREYFGVKEGQTCVLVMGGSLGAGAINETMRDAAQRLLERADVVLIWQTGTRFFEALRGKVGHERLRLLPYLDRMDLAYAVADLAVCRAGAITCSELALTGTPSILVPSPNVTADHQTKNARAMQDAGAAVLLPEPQLSERLFDELESLLNDVKRREAMSASARDLARPEAARTIARAVLALVPTEEAS